MARIDEAVSQAQYQNCRRCCCIYSLLSILLCLKWKLAATMEDGTAGELRFPSTPSLSQSVFVSTLYLSLYVTLLLHATFTIFVCGAD
jgi:hypothetical protein